jgi:hypothetical protein
MKKFSFNCQIRKEPFLIVIYHSSLVKGAMNAACICKLRNGVKKTPQFLLFSMAKGGHNWQLKNRRRFHTLKVDGNEKREGSG